MGEQQKSITDGEAKRLQNEAEDRQRMAEASGPVVREETAEVKAAAKEVLDGIDELFLEIDAESMIKNYIQKGGE